MISLDCRMLGLSNPALKQPLTPETFVVPCRKFRKLLIIGQKIGRFNAKQALGQKTVPVFHNVYQQNHPSNNYRINLWSTDWSHMEKPSDVFLPASCWFNMKKQSCKAVAVSSAGFHDREGQQYCQQCFLTLFASRCQGCSKPILENYISALNSLWHPQCFVCRVSVPLRVWRLSQCLLHLANSLKRLKAHPLSLWMQFLELFLGKGSHTFENL